MPRERKCEAFRLPKPPEVKRAGGISGLGSEFAEAAVRFIGDVRVRIILFDLFVERGGFLRIGLPVDTSHFQQHQRLRNQDRAGV